MFLIRPVADDSSPPLVARVVSIAYPVGDILVLAMVTRLLVVPATARWRFACWLGRYCCTWVETRPGPPSTTSAWNPGRALQSFSR